jgi:hypothetical protein
MLEILTLGKTMAKRQKFKVEHRAGLYVIKHKCVFGLWKDSQKILKAVPNRFVSRDCALKILEITMGTKPYEVEA